MRTATRPTTRAFTLVELALVVALVGILAVSAVPALSALSDSRQAAAWREVERRFVHARTRAMTAGRPFGLRVTPASGQLELLEIPAGGGVPTAARDALGQTIPAWSLPASYPGTLITMFVGGDGATGTGTVWFGYGGAPERRNSSGTLLGPCTQDAVLTLTGGRSVTVRQSSGLIER